MTYRDPATRMTSGQPRKVSKNDDGEKSTEIPPDEMAADRIGMEGKTLDL